MRIAVIGPSRHPLRQPYPGGQERFTAELARGLRDRGHHVELHARSGTDRTLADDVHIMRDTPTLSTIASADPNMPEPNFLRDQVVYLAAVRDLLGRRDIDVVVNQSLHQLPLALSPVFDVPVLTTLHTPPFPWMEIGAWLAGTAGHFVAVSAAVREMWSTLSRVRVIHNGVDPDAFPIGPGGDDLAWVGRLTPEKGADIAIEAAARSGRRLRLAGPVGDAEWFDMVIRPKLQAANVEYLGALGGAALADLYGCSVATLVTPRWEEPFCLVAAESQMCATPVVGVSRGGLREVVPLAGGRLVPEGETAIDMLACAVGVAAGMSRGEVAASARARLSLTTTLDRYEDCIAELCSRRSLPVAAPL